MERFKHWMRQGDIVVVSGGNKLVRAIGKITGDYYFDQDAYPEYMHFRDVEWLFVDNENMIPVERILKEKIFSQQAIYMFGHEDLNMESLRELIAGERSTGTGESQYVLIIDEINRGNISKIFGELITLVESDKRMGQINELSVTLPYSGQRFSVPSNVHLLGTMNTADRSIALLDTALRRRFDFKEMMPRYDLLPDNVEGINVRKLLQTINDRIEFLYDRDHQIGHAYFMTEHLTADYVKQVMVSKVIPLLQEYFYENWESVELVLGGAGKALDNDYLLSKIKLTHRGLFGKSDVADLDKFRYSVQANPSNMALIRVYESLSTLNTEEQDDFE
ncbi:AAA domain-containing protein [Paenibacillus sp. LMG 31458]|uniref:AAA domain-containing protein n=1 Tax=Paenibacillus phytorum TaxID=2654977 RepID=A0ABX1XZI4_9BACL|nr:AAA family ATPase [Paenibacillus phytorum]NOU73982.1 AAA domain-containing protein [Paenibacillus phytorum]